LFAPRSRFRPIHSLWGLLQRLPRFHLNVALLAVGHAPTRCGWYICSSGPDGGIDSTLTARLAVESLGAADVYGLVLPSEVNRDKNVSDAEELGIGYDTLDSILALHVDGPLSPSAAAAELGVEESLVERIGRLHDRTAHKREFPPGPAPLY